MITLKQTEIYIFAENTNVWNAIKYQLICHIVQ